MLSLTGQVPAYGRDWVTTLRNKFADHKSKGPPTSDRMLAGDFLRVANLGVFAVDSYLTHYLVMFWG